MWKLEYELINASPEYVFHWLKENQVEAHDWGNDRLSLEKSLLARDNNLINLGLALYAEESDIGYALYRMSDLALKRAALSGRSVNPRLLSKSWVLNDDVIPALIKGLSSDNKNEEEKCLLNELFQNPLIPDDLLEAVFKKSDIFSDIDHNLWLHILAMTSQNKRLSTPYSESWMDGYAEYLYNSVFYAGWKLFSELPVNLHSARVLLALSYNLYPITHDIDILETIERWRSKDKDEEKAYSHVRKGLVRVIGSWSKEFKTLERSEDLALRQGYFERVNVVEPKDVETWFERDGKDFLDAALHNSIFFKDEGVREAFRRACWAVDSGGHLDYPNYYNSKIDLLASKHPEWFKDSWTGEISFDEIKDADERTEKRLKYLSSQVIDLKKTLVGDEDDYEDMLNRTGFDVRSAFNNIVSKVDLLDLQLQNFYRENSFSWGTLLAGLVVGFILASYV